MNCGIYFILNKTNGKVYVGQTTDFHDRWIKHKHKLRNNYHYNPHLQSAWNKYGEDSFEYHQLEHCSKEALGDCEDWWIDYFDALNREKGYNLRSGGNEHFEVSDETKEKIRIANIGKKLSEETKQKLREANIGKKLSEETKKKISESLTGTERQYNARHQISKAQNNSGYFRVSKRVCNSCKQGFSYSYAYYENGKRKHINSVSIDKLKEKVLNKGLEWLEY